VLSTGGKINTLLRFQKINSSFPLSLLHDDEQLLRRSVHYNFLTSHETVNKGTFMLKAIKCSLLVANMLCVDVYFFKKKRQK